MATVVYNRFKARLASGDLDWDADTIGVLLAQPAYVPNPDHNLVNEVTNELTGGTYVRKNLTTKVVTEDDANDRASMDADDITWAALATVAAGQQIRYLVYYEDVGGTDATRHLIAAVQLPADVTTDGTDFVVQHHANGIGLIT